MNPSCNEISFFLTWYGGNRWQIYKIKRTDISMFINIHIQSKRKSYILRNLWYFLLEILTFSALGVGSCFFLKYHNFPYVSSGMYLMTICGKNCNKTVYSYKNKDYVTRRWYGGTRWQIYKIKTTDISMLIIKHMHSKRKSYILRTLWFFF